MTAAARTRHGRARALRAAPAMLLLVLLLSAPSVSAQAAEVDLHVVRDGDGWHAILTRTIEPNATFATIWAPANARLDDLHLVARAGSPDAVNGSTAANGSSNANHDATTTPVVWRPAGGEAITADVSAGGQLVASYQSLADPTIHYVAPVAEHLTLRVTSDLPVRISGINTARVDAGGADNGADTPGEQYVGAATLQPGDGFDLRLAGRGADGLVVLATTGVLALLGLLATIAWHRLRPPLGGAEPERFLDHLRELQARLVPMAVVFALANILYFAVGLQRGEWFGRALWLPTFALNGSLAGTAFHAFADQLIPPGVTLVVLRPIDAILAQVMMALFLAFLTVLPTLLYEITAFIGPALSDRERGLTWRTIPLVTGLFVAGCVAGFLGAAPLMIRTLYAYAPVVGAVALVSVGELVSFALIIIIVFGIAFELPVAMFALSRVGLVHAATFRRYTRHTILVIVVIAGVVTPDPSVISQLILAVPLTGLYLIGLIGASLGERRADAA